MTLSMTIDRFEGDKKSLAVLLTDSGDQITFPKALLPKGCKAGDVLTFSIERDAAATKDVADRTKNVQRELGASDPGGDIKL